MSTLPSVDSTPFPAPGGRLATLVVNTVPRRLRGLVLQVREDLGTHYHDWTLPGFRAVAVHRFGTWVQQESGHGFVRGPVRIVLRRLHLAMFRYVRNHYGIELPHTTLLGRRVIVGHQSGIVIHPYARIGDDCIIRQNVTIGALNSERDEAPTIGRRVEFGAGAAILGPVTIGDGCRIGPQSVVMTDIAAGSTVFVNPPRMITFKSAAPASPAGGGRDRELPLAAAAR